MGDPAAIPNLFDFGTKELSQDAFVAWLVSWLNVKDGEAAELRRLARRFVALLLEKGKTASGESAETIATPEEILPPLRGENLPALPHLQYQKIDVYFRVRTADGKTYSVIVEDKTDTTMHDQQLERYRNEIHQIAGAADGVPICIYFKKGHVFFWEKEWVRDGKYGLLDAPGFLDLLDGSPAAAGNMIVREYREHLRSVLAERDRETELLRQGVPTALSRDSCQDLFMRSLLDRCPGHVNMDTTTRDYWHAGGRIYTGYDRGGPPWTVFIFACFRSAYGEGCSEVVSYRLQLRGQNPEIKVEQYAYQKPMEDGFKDKKHARRDQLRALFADACADSALPAQVFARNEGGVYGAAIARIDLSTPEAVEITLKHLGAVHKRFVRTIRESYPES
jgi:hypothetical protein